MKRKYIDCREFPGDIKCRLPLAADDEKGMIEAAIQHAGTVHGYQDSAELRQELRSCFRDGTPPLAAPKPAPVA